MNRDYIDRIDKAGRKIYLKGFTEVVPVGNKYQAGAVGGSMNVLCILAQSGLDAGALAVCCEGVFQKRSEARGKIFRFFLFCLFCVLSRG